MRLSAEERAKRLAAGNKLRMAVYRGEIERPTVCERCGYDMRPCFGHHHDYDKPFDVEWLCFECHQVAHGKFADYNWRAGEDEPRRNPRQRRGKSE